MPALHLPPTRAILFATWPAADRAARTRAVAPAARYWLDAVAPAARRLARRRANALIDAGRFASWLAASGDAAPTEDAGLAARTTPKCLAAVAEAERSRELKLASIVAAVDNVIGVARPLAPYHDWQAAYAVLNGIRTDARAARAALPRAPGRALRARHRAHGGHVPRGGSRGRSGGWQDGLLVALLAAAALRIAKFAALWVGAYGQPLDHRSMWARTAAFGRPVLPHGFRHCAANAFALKHPEQPRDAAALLGHAGPRTTERHYVLSR